MAKRLEGDWPRWRRDALVVSSGGLANPKTAGRFEQIAWQTLLEVYAETRERHRQSDFADRFDHLSILWLANDGANALAIERDGHRAVAVYTGLLRRLWAALQLGMSSPNFLDGCFDTPPIAITTLVAGQPLRPDVMNHLPLAEWPEERRFALWDLFQRALTFFLCHELGHHARGHIDLVHERLGFEAIDELRAAGTSGPDHRLLRMLEFDADTDAIDMILIAESQEAKRAGWSTEKTEAQGFQWLVAIVVLFLALDLEFKEIGEHYRGSHPAPVHRAIHAVGTFARSYADLFKWGDEKEKFYQTEAWDAGAVIAEALGYPEGRWYGDHTVLMDLERFGHEERSFFEFEKWLTAVNTNMPAVEPDWLRRLT